MQAGLFSFQLQAKKKCEQAFNVETSFSGKVCMQLEGNEMLISSNTRILVCEAGAGSS